MTNRTAHEFVEVTSKLMDVKIALHLPRDNESRENMKAQIAQLEQRLVDILQDIPED